MLAYEKLLTVQAVAVVAADESFLSLLKRFDVVEAVGRHFSLHCTFSPFGPFGPRPRAR